MESQSIDIPEYEISDLTYTKNIPDDEYLSDFASFIDAVISSGAWDEEPYKGILVCVSEKGTKNLTTKQLHRLKEVVGNYSINFCQSTGCGEQIPLHELYDTEYCSYHVHSMSKDD